MANVAEERLWLRRKAADAQAADEERRRAWREEEARTCAYCFHDAHVSEIGAFGIWPDFVQHGPTSVTVLSCRIEGCACGVPPCNRCGSRERVDGGDRYTERCAGCGREWQATAIG